VASGMSARTRNWPPAGPYACTRHPLYLGSMIIAAVLLLPARNLWILLALVLMFALIYLPV